MRHKLLILVIAMLFCTLPSMAQTDISQAKWTHVVKRMPSEWYASDQAVAIADTVVKYQCANGGWPKNINFHKEVKYDYIAEINETGIGATIDNDATTLEMKYLAKVYAFHNDPKYRVSFMRAFEYLLEAQYPNGGWPQFYPVRPPVGVHYSQCITYNDNAIANVMFLLKDIYEDNSSVKHLEFSDIDRQRAKQAFDKGIKNILDCQIRKNGILTVWCAQHDKDTLLPAKARAYELESFSGFESAPLIELLMSLPSPSAEIKDAVTCAVAWLKAHAIYGIKVERFLNDDGVFDCRVTVDENAPAVWARFYDLDTEEPFFCDRDGIKRSVLSEVGIERRGGYSWYTTEPQSVIDKYETWREANLLPAK